MQDSKYRCFFNIQKIILLFSTLIFSVNSEISRRNDKFQCLVRLDQYQYSLYLLDKQGGLNAQLNEVSINIMFCNSLQKSQACSEDQNIYNEYASIKNSQNCEYLYVSKYEKLNEQNAEKGIQIYLEGKSGTKVLVKLNCDFRSDLKNVEIVNKSQNSYEISATTLNACPSIDISYPWGYFEDNSELFSAIFIILGMALLFEVKETDFIMKVTLSIILGLIITTIIYQQNYVGNSWMSSIEIFRFSLGIGLCTCAFIFAFKDLSFFINGAFIGYLIHLAFFNLIYGNRDKYFFTFYQLELWIVTLFGILNIIFQEQMTNTSYKFFSAVALQLSVDLMGTQYEYMNLFKGGNELKNDDNKYLYIINTCFIFLIGVILQKLLKK
ncbi:hypothetical protein ABPG72_009389 [Tetrahymena utriculariae]